MSSASFRVDVTPADASAFAALSGDWNPLHTSPEHAARTAYRRPVLHGAFSAGIVSRMAGMHLPGADCLLHSMRLRFVAPIVPPASLVVSGRQVAASSLARRTKARRSTRREAEGSGPGVDWGSAMPRKFPGVGEPLSHRRVEREIRGAMRCHRN